MDDNVSSEIVVEEEEAIFRVICNTSLLLTYQATTLFFSVGVVAGGGPVGEER